MTAMQTIDLSVRNLGVYDLGPYGCLPTNPLRRLSEPFEIFEQIADNLPSLNNSKQTRIVVNKLPPFPYNQLQDMELKRAHLVLGLLAHSYVWCDKDNVIDYIPENIAVAFWRVSKRMGVKPILTYSDVILNNYALNGREFCIENLTCLNTMTGTNDEKWFYLVHVYIEYEAAPIIKGLLDVYHDTTRDTVSRVLGVIKRQLGKIIGILNRMREQCDPVTFFGIIRLYLHGWDNENFPDGICYRGINNNQYVKLVGGSGAQTAIFQIIDASLGITHTSDYFVKVLKYMPQGHRYFIAFVRHNINLRTIVETMPSDELNELLNGCVNMLSSFRKHHTAATQQYIVKHLPKPSDEASGSGATPFQKFLKQVLDETK